VSGIRTASVLMIEADGATASDAASVLRQVGYAVSLAENVERALALSLEATPNLVLLEVPCTRDSMREAVKTVTSRFLSATLIGLYSYDHMYGRTAEAFAMLRSIGFKEVILKPIQADTMLMLLDKVLADDKPRP
jgi:DNA-binding NtrC family response regulator